MDPAGIPALLDAIRHMHCCVARYLATVHVHEVAPVVTGGPLTLSAGGRSIEHAIPECVGACLARVRGRVRRDESRPRSTGGTRRRAAGMPRMQAPRASIRASPSPCSDRHVRRPAATRGVAASRSSTSAPSSMGGFSARTARSEAPVARSATRQHPPANSSAAPTSATPGRSASTRSSVATVARTISVRRPPLRVPARRRARA